MAIFATINMNKGIRDVKANSRFDAPLNVFSKIIEFIAITHLAKN